MEREGELVSKRAYLPWLFVMGMALMLCACTGEKAPFQTQASSKDTANSSDLSSKAKDPPDADAFLTPTASGTVVYQGGGADIDASNVQEGYVTVRYSGESTKLRAQVAKSGGSTYTYVLSNNGNNEVLPFTQGDGSYTVSVYENVSGDYYALVLSQEITVQMRDDFLPFLYPNQYVNFTQQSKTVAQAAGLTAGLTDELEMVQSVYDYVIENITYDYEKAQTVSFGYLPDVDAILERKTGICFDYAAVMTAMLRSQKIPTKLVIGYAGELYHAWISTYITDIGWVDGIISFDGKNWKRMDPTFASSGEGSQEIMDYIANDQNYKEVYVY